MKRKVFILGGAAVLLGVAGAGGWLLLGTDRDAAPAPPAPVPLVLATNAEIDLLQADAVAACRCARRRHETPSQSPCYADFQHAIDRYEHDEMGSLCMPIAPTEDCFRLGNGRDRCITRDWGGDACSEEEARTLEAIDADSDRHPNEARERWAAAVQSFIRGERVPAPRHSGGGCSG